jgi:4a-hydroxytetrahydrobiopterin dehydratase
MADLIPKSELEKRIKKIPEWDLEDTTVNRVVEFESFPEAIDFVNDVSEIAEEAQHHPDIDIRYTRITLSLTTHEKGGLTDLDFEIASRIDTLID